MQFVKGLPIRRLAVACNQVNKRHLNSFIIEKYQRTDNTLFFAAFGYQFISCRLQQDLIAQCKHRLSKRLRPQNRFCV